MSENISVTLTRRIHCTADEEILYSVSRSDWESALLDSDGDTIQALDQLRSDGKAESECYNIEVDNITETHEENVDVDNN